MLFLALLAGASAVAPGPRDDAAPADIIVTGERVRRTLKETQSSVHVEGRHEIEAKPADRVEQLLAAIPNVQLGTGSQGPVIRGQDTTGALQALPSFLGGNRPRMTVVVDGRAETYNEFIFGSDSLWDVDRVEVFRSPQTTTQGQNSIAGAIFVYTAEPAFEPEYRARAIVGDLKTRQASALVSAPLNSDVALRLAGDVRYSRTTSVIVDRIEGGDPSHDVYGLVRAKLLVQPSALPDTRLTITAVHRDGQAPQTVQTTPPLKERRDASGGYGVFRINSDSVTAALRNDSGALSTNAILTFGDTSAKRLAPKGFGQAFSAGRDWSAEGVANWDEGGALHLTGGFALRHAELRQRIDLSVLSGIPHFRDWQDGEGVFGEARLAIGPRASITAGMRYQRDRQRRVGAFDAASGPIDLNYQRTFDAWLPKLSISFDVSKAVTAGAFVEKAYNPGGTTLRFDTGMPDNFDAEHLWDYEAFVRASAAGGRLSFNANLFYYDIRGAQRAQDIRIRAPNGLVVGFADLFNIPKARAYGAEVEAEWKSGQRLTARAGLGLMGTKVTEPPADYPQFDGKAFERSPALSASASVDWKATDRLRLSGQVRHHSRYYSDNAESSAARVPAGTIADARAELAVGRASLFLYMRNVFDALVITSRTPIWTTLDDPREVGAGVDMRF